MILQRADKNLARACAAAVCQRDNRNINRALLCLVVTLFAFSVHCVHNIAAVDKRIGNFDRHIHIAARVVAQVNHKLFHALLGQRVKLLGKFIIGVYAKLGYCDISYLAVYHFGFDRFALYCGAVQHDVRFLAGTLFEYAQLYLCAGLALHGFCNLVNVVAVYVFAVNRDNLVARDNSRLLRRRVGQRRNNQNLVVVRVACDIKSDSGIIVGINAFHKVLRHIGIHIQGIRVICAVGKPRQRTVNQIIIV